MFDRRQFFLSASGLSLLLLADLEANAQSQVLPGPFGYIGNPSGVDTDGPIDDEDEEDDEADEDTKKALEDAADLLNDVGAWGMGAGGVGLGIGGGIVATTGETGIGAGVGIGVMVVSGAVGIGGIVAGAAGVAAGYIADDPPRPDYKQAVNCEAGSFEDFPNYQQADATVQAAVDAASKLFASAGGTLAALEYWQGANAANDDEWRTKHRASFVKHWNSMRSLLIEYAIATRDSLLSLRSAVQDSGISYATFARAYRENKKEIESFARQEYLSVSNKFEASCQSEAGILKRFIADTPYPDELPSLRDIKNKLDRLEKIAEALPTYS